MLQFVLLASTTETASQNVVHIVSAILQVVSNVSVTGRASLDVSQDGLLTTALLV